MQSLKVSLKDEYPVEGGVLECILTEDINDTGEAWTRPAVIVVPGGAYCFVSKREAEPVAQSFLSRGFQAFILTYLEAADGVAYPEELIELASSVDYIKKNAEKFHVNPEEVFVVGFSAGGHLTADLAVEWATASEKAGVALDCKPAAVGLAYPVISNKYGHLDSHNNLLMGYTDEAKAELLKTLNLDEAVDEKTTPSFIWTTAEDGCVPCENSLAFAWQLARRKIPYELHVYPQGGHGASVCNFEVNQPGEFLRRNAKWVDDCAAFFRLFTKETF